MVFLSLFDYNPLVHDTFCPPRRRNAGELSRANDAASTA